jgi:hypothetical protein
MKKLLFLAAFAFAILGSAQSIDQTLLGTLTEETNGKFEKTNFYSVVLNDSSKEIIKTTVEGYNSVISRDNFVRYYPQIVESTIYEYLTNIRSIALTNATADLPILILNFKINRNGANIEVIDFEGPKNLFKNWAAIEKIVKFK